MTDVETLTVIDLDAESATDAERVARRGRSARMLLRNAALRVSLLTIGAEGAIPEHVSEGPITVQPLAGELTFTAAGRAHVLRPGQLVSLPAGVRHSLASAGGASLLLTVARPQGGPGRPPS